MLYSAFGEYNRAHFARKLAAPLVLITQPKSARNWGDYTAKDAHGLASRIRIAPRCVARGELFARDVLLHEMIHAWMHEVEGRDEHGYRGHGPLFAAKCNAIGAKLGLDAVGVKARDGLPDCAYWPHNVRPDGYYPIPFVAPTRSEKPASEASGEGEGESEALVSMPRPSSAALASARDAAELLEGDEDVRAVRTYLLSLAAWHEAEG